VSVLADITSDLAAGIAKAKARANGAVGNAVLNLSNEIFRMEVKAATKPDGHVCLETLERVRSATKVEFETRDGKQVAVVTVAAPVFESDARLHALKTRAVESAPAWQDVDPDAFQADARGKG